MSILRDKVLTLVCEKQGDFYEIMKALQNKEYPATIKTEKAMVILDEDYPEFLKNAPKPPFAIFYEGNKELLKRSYTHIGFVDDFTQADTEEGKYNRELIIENLNKAHICVLRHKKGKVNKTLDELKKVARNEIVLICSCGIDLNDSDIKYVLDHNGVVISSVPSTQHEELFLNDDTAEMTHAYLSDLLYVNEINKEGYGALLYATDRLGLKVATSPYSNFKSLRYNNTLIQMGCYVILNGLDFDKILLQ